KCLNGCSYCNNKKILLYDVEMVKFLSEKMYGDIFDFDLNDKNIIYNNKSLLQIKCKKNSKHESFDVTIGKLLSKAKIAKIKGCEECNESTIQVKIPRNKWLNNLDLLKIKGYQIHGDVYN